MKNQDYQNMLRKPYPLSVLCSTLLFVVTIIPFPAAAQQATAAATQSGDFTALKTYLLAHCDGLKQNVDALKVDSQTFYDLAKAAQFDYSALWKNHASDVIKALKSAQTDWIALNPQYEGMEGIVAGVPSLSKYDPILDSGVAGQVDLDVPLPDGRVLPKPGNLMALTQEALWGTDKTLIIDQPVDFDGDGIQGFGEVMPNAVLLKGFADSLAEQSDLLLMQASNWLPTESDVFSALVINVPTMSDFFNAWKDSRFVLGDKATRSDFAVTSRLADIHANVTSWQAMWSGLGPVVKPVDAARFDQINSELVDIDAYITDLYQHEQAGKRFTPEEADTFSSEAQNRATRIVGGITQVAAELNISLPQGQ
jgi:hypothetical protein